MAKSDIVITKSLDSFIAKISNIDGIAKKSIEPVFRKFVTDIFQDVLQRSPVDKGSYRADWEMKDAPAEAGVLIAKKLVNNQPHALVLEEGSEKGKLPWPTAGQTYVRKGKVVGPLTIEKDGRVWSKKMPEPVAGGAVDSADWKGLRKAITDAIKREF